MEQRIRCFVCVDRGERPRRLTSIVRASAVKDTEAAFDAAVKDVNDNEGAHERGGCQVVRFKNRCMAQRPGGSLHIPQIHKN